MTDEEPTTQGDRPTDGTEQVRFWMREIDEAKKREQMYRKTGRRVLDIYTAEKSDASTQQPSTVPFNILFSNTETLSPALYSQVPRPVVTRRFKDADPMGKAAAEAAKRVLEFLLDTNTDGYETYDEAMQSATLHALLPGRAWTSVKYDFDSTETPDGATAINWELACLESRVWDRVYHGYARKWSKVPWVAYEEFLDRDECVQKFGEERANVLVYTENAREEASEYKTQETDQHQGARKTVCVYQIWDKAGGKRVRWVSPQYPNGYLLDQEDPLGMTGFFNCPKPLTFLHKPDNLTPTALYVIYENQASELNKIQRRINHVVEAIKARGVYDGALGTEIEKVLSVEECGLVPSDRGASLAAEKGFQNAIWFMPLDVLVATLQQLYTAREACKQVIYEITGISDIIRGSSKASETLGAQEIKNQWGTLRLKRMQREVQRYTRDMMRMLLEVAATKFSVETWAKMTGLPFVTAEQQQQAKMVAMQAQTMGQPLDPQTQQKLQAPVWESVLQLLKDDGARAYRIDIETNSTVEPEAAEDQKQIAELMTAMGQYLNGVTPLVVNGSLPFGAAQAMLLAITRRFRFGAEIEEYVQAMQPPKPPDDGKDDQAAQEKAALQEQQMQMQQKQNEMDLQSKTLAAQKQLQDKSNELALREMELGNREKMLKMSEQMAHEKLAMHEQTFQTKVSATDKVRSMKDAGSKREEQVAKSADNKLASGVSAMQQVVEQMAQMQTQLIAELTKQSDIQEQRINTVVQALTAPRKKRAIRGKDGKIEAVEEMIA